MAYLSRHGFKFKHSQNISEEILKLLSFIDSTSWNSGQRLDNFDQTHLVLTSGKLVLQKNLTLIIFYYYYLFLKFLMSQFTTFVATNIFASTKFY